jgi:hypothetical protein
MESLLGQFYSRIKGSQEDIASEGLTYILQRSKAARVALYKIIKNDFGRDFGDLSFSTQNAGDKLERPDISGYNLEGKEVLIIEAKFWAALTENQPLEYLKRLQDNSALIFICPTLRVRPILDELQVRIKNSLIYTWEIIDANSIKVENKYISVKTWDEILSVIRLHLVQNNEQALLSDIDQIIGLCNTIDNETFLPLQSEDFSPSIARRINSYYDLVDKVVDELKKRGIADTTGVRATPQKYGYTRFFKVGELGVSINLKLDFWAKWADTPFWINFADIISPKTWSRSPELSLKMKNVSSQLGITSYESIFKWVFFPLYPLLNKTEDIVINDLTDQIIRLINFLEG